MNEFVSSAFLLVAEFALFLVVVLSAIAYAFKKKRTKARNLAKGLVEKLKSEETDKRGKIREMLNECPDVDESKIENVVESLINCEKLLYTNLISIFLGHEVDKISSFDKDVNRMVERYLEVSRVEVKEEGGDKESNVVKLREENKHLRESLLQTKTDLDAAMSTMESMMAEYASMYEGGKKEGEKKMKNEMFKLKQTLEKKVKLPDDDDDEVEDLDLDVDDK
ncbi:MAG: hypothetical protein OEY89_10240 [Gammaproteobacteria bacterium]|nr:hypothetical protein [Gammaproteobacteria bacterium]